MPISNQLQPVRNRTANARATVVGLGTLLGLAFTVPALAEPATAEGARKLTEAFQSYIGVEPFAKGFLAVAPNGESYDLSISFDSRQLDTMPQDGVTKLDRYIVHLTPKSDGTWGVGTDRGPIALSWTSLDPALDQKFNVRFNDCISQGVFDPKIMAFPTLSTKCANTVVTVRAPDGDFDLTTGEFAADGTGKAGANGGLDLQSDTRLAMLIGKFVDKKSPDHFPVTFRLGAMHYVATTEGFRTLAIADLIRFVHDTATLNKSEVPQDALKTKLRAALPLWENVNVAFDLDDGAVETPVGSAKLAHIEHKQDLAGVTKDFHYTESIAYSGLELPPTAAPDWVRSLIPSQASYDTKLTFSGLDGMIEALIRGVDLSKEPPISKMAGVAMMMRFLNGQPRYDLAVDAKAQAYAVKGQGQATLSPEPQASLALSASGYDAVVEALSKSGDPDLQKTLLGLTFIKGLAKGTPDGQLTWNVSYDMVTNKLWVNDQGFPLPDPD
jgi:hypothetical protein